MRSKNKISRIATMPMAKKNAVNPIFKLLFLGMTMRAWLKYSDRVQEKIKAAEEEGQGYVFSESDEEDYTDDENSEEGSSFDQDSEDSDEDEDDYVDEEEEEEDDDASEAVINNESEGRDSYNDVGTENLEDSENNIGAPDYAVDFIVPQMQQSQQSPINATVTPKYRGSTFDRRD